MSTIVIQYQMQVSPFRGFAVDLAQEFKKFFIAMKRIASPDYRAFQYIQRCKKASSPITFIIVRHGSASPLLHWQSGLGSIQRLYLRLFVDTQHQGFIRWVQIQSDHIRQFFNTPFILGQFKGLGSMGLQPMSIPDSRNTGMTYPQFLRHCPCAPVSCVSRRSLKRALHNRTNFMWIQTLGTQTVRSV